MSKHTFYKNMIPAMQLAAENLQYSSADQIRGWDVIDEATLEQILNESKIQDNDKNGQYLVRRLHSPFLEEHNKHAIVFSFILPILNNLRSSWGVDKNVSFNTKVNLALYTPKTHTVGNNINCVVLEGVKILDLEAINSQIAKLKDLRQDLRQNPYLLKNALKSFILTPNKS